VSEPFTDFDRGVLTLRTPVRLGADATDQLWCAHWAFRNEQGLGFSVLESRGPVNRALFAVAYSAPVNDPADQAHASCDMLAMIPMENVLGFLACNKAPPGAWSIEKAAVPA
jgi:hypothetical protein